MCPVTRILHAKVGWIVGLSHTIWENETSGTYDTRFKYIESLPDPMGIYISLDMRPSDMNHAQSTRSILKQTVESVIKSQIERTVSE